MSDVGRKTAPDKERLNRERPVTKALEFPFCTGKSFCCCFFSSELEQRVRDGMYTERQDETYGGREPPKKRKAKVAILKSILSLTASDRKAKDA